MVSSRTAAGTSKLTDWLHSNVFLDGMTSSAKSSKTVSSSAYLVVVPRGKSPSRS